MKTGVPHVSRLCETWESRQREVEASYVEQLLEVDSLLQSESDLGALWTALSLIFPNWMLAP